MSRTRWAFFLSGRGSNLDAACELLAEMDVALCVSSRAGAPGLGRARRLGIPNLVYKSNPQDPDWTQLSEELQKRKINRIFLLGFMKILPAAFCQKWQGRMWNLHPSLLPDHPGLNAIEKSYELGQKMGVSIHEVTAQMDAGPLCLQKKITDQAQKDFEWPQAQLAISRTEQRLVREWARRKWI